MLASGAGHVFVRPMTNRCEFQSEMFGGSVVYWLVSAWVFGAMLLLHSDAASDVYLCNYG